MDLRPLEAECGLVMSYQAAATDGASVSLARITRKEQS